MIATCLFISYVDNYCWLRGAGFLLLEASLRLVFVRFWSAWAPWLHPKRAPFPVRFGRRKTQPLSIRCRRKRATLSSEVRCFRSLLMSPLHCRYLNGRTLHLQLRQDKDELCPSKL